MLWRQLVWMRGWISHARADVGRMQIELEILMRLLSHSADGNFVVRGIYYKLSRRLVLSRHERMDHGHSHMSCWTLAHFGLASLPSFEWRANKSGASGAKLLYLSAWATPTVIRRWWIIVLRKGCAQAFVWEFGPTAGSLLCFVLVLCDDDVLSLHELTQLRLEVIWAWSLRVNVLLKCIKELCHGSNMIKNWIFYWWIFWNVYIFTLLEWILKNNIPEFKDNKNKTIPQTVWFYQEFKVS